MKIQAHLRKLLLAEQAIASKLGNRLFWSKAPANVEMPYCFFTCSYKEPLRHTRGSENYAESLFSFHCVGETEDQVDALTEALKNRLRNYKGFDNGSKVFETVIGDDTEDDWSDATGLYRRILEVEVSHTI